MILKRWGREVLELLFPRQCCGCGQRLASGEQLVCMECQCCLPLETLRDWEFNRHKVALGSHPALFRVGALTRYDRTNISAELVRSLKFRRRHELGNWMGRVAAELLGDTGLFEGRRRLPTGSRRPSAYRCARTSCSGCATRSHRRISCGRSATTTCRASSGGSPTKGSPGAM